MTASEYAVGDEVRIELQPRGGGEPEYRGTVVIEDLTGVVTRTASTRGVNGPQSPVTQFLLAQAAQHLNEAFVRDMDSLPDAGAVPRLLSAAVGHEPFIEQTLNLSVHHMRRRWPLAGDWYADLVSYILSSGRAGYLMVSDDQWLEWVELPLGELLGRVAERMQRTFHESVWFPLSQTMRAMWPNYEPVKEAVRREEQFLHENWRALFAVLADHYGLRFHPEVDVGELLWATVAMADVEARHRRLENESPLMSTRALRPGAVDATFSNRATMIMLAGAVSDATTGRMLSVTELSTRMPVTAVQGDTGTSIIQRPDTFQGDR